VTDGRTDRQTPRRWLRRAKHSAFARKNYDITFVSFDGPLQRSRGFILSALSPKDRFFFIVSRPSVASKARINTAVPSPVFSCHKNDISHWRMLLTTTCVVLKYTSNTVADGCPVPGNVSVINFPTNSNIT